MKRVVACMSMDEGSTGISNVSVLSRSIGNSKMSVPAGISLIKISTFSFACSGRRLMSDNLVKQAGQKGLLRWCFYHSHLSYSLQLFYSIYVNEPW